MQQNVGGIDRTARLIAGTALLSGGIFARNDPRWRAVMLAGSAIALGTAATRYCPANAMLRMNSTAK